MPAPDALKDDTGRKVQNLASELNANTFGELGHSFLATWQISGGGRTLAPRSMGSKTIFKALEQLSR